MKVEIPHNVHVERIYLEYLLETTSYIIFWTSLGNVISTQQHSSYILRIQSLLGAFPRTNLLNIALKSTIRLTFSWYFV